MTASTRLPTREGVLQAAAAAGNRRGARLGQGRGSPSGRCVQNPGRVAPAERAGPGVKVTDAEVRDAQRYAFSRLRLVVEPGGAAALAAALAGKVPLDESTVIMLTGGNADPAAFSETLASAG